MKKLLCFLLIAALSIMPVMANAQAAFDMKLVTELEGDTIEVGDQFLVNIKIDGDVLPYLTFRINGEFDKELAEIVAPVYTNEVLGILTNKFDNEQGVFTFEGYDQQIRGTAEPIICSILFKANNPGEFKVTLADDCMLGKANENAFYVLDSADGAYTIKADTDDETVSIIEDAKPLTPYDDMFGYDWAEKAVGVMATLGVLEDIADTSFYPAQNITRGEFVTMLMRVCKQKSTKEIEPFGDVSEDSYQYESVMIAKALGIAKGDENGNFRPDEFITRQDICALVFRTMLKMNKVNPEIVPEDYISSFEDKGEIAEYAVESVAGLIRAKLIIGDDTGLLRPADNMTRAEAAVLLNRLAEFNILVSR